MVVRCLVFIMNSGEPLTNKRMTNTELHLLNKQLNMKQAEIRSQALLDVIDFNVVIKLAKEGRKMKHILDAEREI